MWYARRDHTAENTRGNNGGFEVMCARVRMRKCVQRLTVCVCAGIVCACWCNGGDVSLYEHERYWRGWAGLQEASHAMRRAREAAVKYPSDFSQENGKETKARVTKRVSQDL